MRFIIHKLGALRDTSFDYKSFMIFSGDSGLGKSYAAFLSYYFTDSLLRTDGLISFIEEVSGKKASEINQLNQLSIKISSEQFQSWLNRNVSRYIGYLVGNESLEANVEFDFDFPDFTIGYKVKEEGGEKIIFTLLNGVAYNRGAITLPCMSYLIIKSQIELSSRLNGITYQKNILLPPARAALMGASISSTNAIMSTGMYKEFVEVLDNILAASYKEHIAPSYLEESIQDILGGELTRQDGRLYYSINNVKLPINAAASSVKELSPLFLLLQRYRAKELSVLIEEPEAHLHPRIQVKVAELITHAVNDGASFQVTTHSDYFLGRINDLLKLYYIQSKVSGLDYDKLCTEIGINKDLTLSPKKVGAYYFKRREDGSVEIVTQDPTRGIPFDTFEDTVKQTTSKSFALDDFMEEHNL